MARNSGKSPDFLIIGVTIPTCHKGRESHSYCKVSLSLFICSPSKFQSLHCTSAKVIVPPIGEMQGAEVVVLEGGGKLWLEPMQSP